MTELKPVITLKSIKHMPSLSEETAAYTATIYVDGVKFAYVSNRGHGGCDEVTPCKGTYSQIEELEGRIKATYEPYYYKGLDRKFEESLEGLCNKELDKYLFAKEWKGRLKRKIYGIKEGAIFTWPAKYKPTAQILTMMRDKFKDHVFINDMPEEKAFELIRATEG